MKVIMVIIGVVAVVIYCWYLIFHGDESPGESPEAAIRFSLAAISVLLLGLLALLKVSAS